MSVLAGLMIVIQLSLLDYQQWDWSANGGAYAGIIAMVLALLSIYFSHRYEKRQERRES